MSKSRVAYSERPYQALLELLSNRGIHALGSRVWLHKKRVAEQGFQYVAVESLVREYNVYYDRTFKGENVYETSYKRERFKLLMSPGSERSDGTVSSKGSIRDLAFTWSDLADLLPNPPLPLFVVDMSMRFIHSEDELAKLRLQIAVSLNVVRRYLWDPHLALTSIDPSTVSWLKELAGENKMTVIQSKPSELLWSMDADRVIILRPDAPQQLTGNDIMMADAFLIGGIVDKIPRPGISRVLDNLVPWGSPRRIELRGSVVGVPERINRIIEILLKARYDYPGDLEKSIVTSMTRKDVVARAYIEIVRHARKEPGRLVVSWDLYDDLRSWLPLTEEDFLKAAERARAVVVGGRDGG